MSTISKKEFYDLLDYNIKKIGMTKSIIIENAAQKVMKHIDLNNRKTFVIICGVNMNGSYGLALARNLVSEGKNVEVFIVETDNKKNEDFSSQFEIIKNTDIKINYLETIEELENFSKKINSVNTIIDAITGIEYDFKFHGTTEYIIDVINKSRIYTISIDIPSGMDYDTGETKIACIMSDLVVTFFKSKKGIKKNIGLHRFIVKIENIGLLEREKYVRYKSY